MGIVLVAGCGACGGSTSTAAPAPPGTSRPARAASTSAGAAIDDPTRDAVVRAHRDAEHAFEIAAIAVDPDPARLSATTAEPVLGRRISILHARQTQGWVTSWPSESVHRDDVVGYELIDAHTAELVVCVVDDAVLIDRDTGEVVNAEVGIHRQRHHFGLVGQVWKLTGRSTLASGEAARCDG